MPCTNCNSGPISTFGQSYFYSNNPSNCGDSECGNNSLNAKCVYYAGPNLSCSGVSTNDSIELALQKIDQQICSVVGDYSTYNFSCLDDVTPITTEGDFVSTISSFVCTLRTDLDTFIDVTFPAYQDEVDARFDAIEIPGTTPSSNTGVIVGDTLPEILDKISGAIDDIYGEELSLTGITWDACFTVTTPPANIPEAISLILDQICQVKETGGSATLPTFNNVGSCLDTPGAADSLETTITKIKTRLCESPTLDNTSLTSTCVDIPGTATDLQELLQNILDKVDGITQNLPTFDSGDFVVTATNVSDVCAGKTVALATPIDQDRFVAVDASDTTPDTLVNKLVEGTGITIAVVGSTLEISASGDTDTKEVKASAADDDPGFLDEKTEGKTGNAGLAITTAYNSVTKKLEHTPSIDEEILIDVLFTLIETNQEIKDRFCELVNACPTPCEAPTNVQAVAV